MAGFLNLLETGATALFNLLTPRHLAGGKEPEPVRDGDFLIGESKPFGKNFTPVGYPISVPFESLSRHMSLLGATGTGKTTLFNRAIPAFLKAEQNVVVIDFRGDLALRTLKVCLEVGLPPERVTYVDCGDEDWIFPFNLLAHGPGNDHSRTAIVYGALKAASLSWGTRLGNDLLGALTALSIAKGSLLDVAAVLGTDPTKRQELLATVQDDFAREFLSEFDALPPEAQQTRAAACSNKLTGEYLSLPYMRLSLGAPSAPDFTKIMDEKGHATILALATDRNPRAALLGRMIISCVQRSAMARVDIPEKDRVKVFLLVDEAQNLLDEDACTILAEGRKFGLGLLCATQFGANYPPHFRAALRVNAALQLQYSTSNAEASDFAAEIASDLSRDEIRRIILGAKTGEAVVTRRGEPAAFVSTTQYPDPKVDEREFRAYRLACLALSSIPRAEAERLAQTRREKPSPEQEVTHVRRPRRKA